MIWRMLLNKKIKAIALLSGGLDSALAVKIILEQGIEVIGVKFTSPFCNCDPVMMEEVTAQKPVCEMAKTTQQRNSHLPEA